MTITLLDGYGKLDRKKYELLLLGSDISKEIPPKSIDYLPENSWSLIYSEMKTIDSLEGKSGVLQNFLDNSEKWKELYESYDPS